MSLRIRADGTIWCAALNKEKEGDIYIDDNLHYYLSVEAKVLVTTYVDYHMENKGEWWMKGSEPKDVLIDKYYYS